MKSIYLVLCLAVVVAVAIGSYSISSAQVHRGPAVLYKDELCFVEDAIPPPPGEEPELFIIPGTVAVETNSKNGNVLVTCHGSLAGVPGAVIPDKAVVYNYKTTGGVQCFDPYAGVQTTKWSQVLTPSGKVMLSCTYAKNFTSPWTPPE